MTHGNWMVVVVAAVAVVMLSGCGATPTIAPTIAPTPKPSVTVTILTEAGNAVLDADAKGVCVAGAAGSSEKFGWAEGPLWLPTEEMWIFSDIVKSTQWKFKDGVLSVYRQPSNKTNGNTLDKDGFLLSCEHESRALSSTNTTSGQRTEIASEFGGNPLTSPNDVIVSRTTGIVYFTDPDYGITANFGHGQPSEQETNRVYRFDPETELLTPLVDDFERPNGLCFSPNEKKLYISDTGAAVAGGEFNSSLPHHVRVFDTDGTTLSNGKVFATLADGEGVPDGIKSDEAGNIWVSSEIGVHVFSPDGTKIAKISTPSVTANMAFGGQTGKDLLLTSMDSAWLLTTKVKGAGQVSDSALMVV